LFATREEEEST